VDDSQHTAARVAGFTLVFGMAIAIFGEFFIASKLLVPHNAVDTARNILSHQTLFRLYVACDLLYAVNLVVLLSALYVILRPVNQGLALAAALCRFAYALMWVFAALNLLGALRLLEGADYLHVFEPERLQALARSQIRGNFDTYYVGLPFFALASTFCGWLWLKSGYIPRAFAVYGVAASAWGALCAFIFIVFPHFNGVVSDWWFDTPLGVFELALGLWLLFKGLRRSGTNEPVHAASDFSSK
jgi:hypothetical protein